MHKNTPFPSHLFVHPMFISSEGVIALLQTDFFTIKPSYSEMTSKIISGMRNATLTNNFYEKDIPENSIAFHSVRGTILADSDYPWMFSSKKLREDLLAADMNSNIMAHVLSINSGGGEAWYLDVLSETIKNLTKPVVANVEKYAASAAYYIATNADKIFASTENDVIGSIGTMVSFWDVNPYLEKEGFVKHEHYAEQSDLKNKVFNDLLKNKPDEYIEKNLNPLATQFINAIKGRKKLAALPEDHPVFRGETFNAKESIDIGLIDGIKLLDESIQTAIELGLKQIEGKKGNKKYQEYFTSNQ